MKQHTALRHWNHGKGALHQNGPGFGWLGGPSPLSPPFLRLWLQVTSGRVRKADRPLPRVGNLHRLQPHFAEYDMHVSISRGSWRTGGASDRRYILLRTPHWGSWIKMIKIKAGAVRGKSARSFKKDAATRRTEYVQGRGLRWGKVVGPWKGTYIRDTHPDPRPDPPSDRSAHSKRRDAACPVA